MDFKPRNTIVEKCWNSANPSLILCNISSYKEFSTYPFILDHHESSEILILPSEVALKFEARDLEQWSHQVNGTIFVCLAFVHHQKSNLNLVVLPGENLHLCPWKRRQNVITKLSHVGMLQWSTWSNYFKPSFDWRLASSAWEGSLNLSKNLQWKLY